MQEKRGFYRSLNQYKTLMNPIYVPQSNSCVRSITRDGITIDANPISRSQISDVILGDGAKTAVIHSYRYAKRLLRRAPALLYLIASIRTARRAGDCGHRLSGTATDLMAYEPAYDTADHRASYVVGIASCYQFHPVNDPDIGTLG